jgi:BirA family biotin operon repressor/biotin-[acetyl-CoA-carboxylase] ligase
MQPVEEWRLDTRRVGRRVLHFDRVDSTNTQAAARAHDPANDGLVLLADEQTAGRGRLGRTWQSWPGKGVLLSVLLFPPPPLRRPAMLTAWAAVSVCKTIHSSTGTEAQIKWPNDILLGGRKVCGILIEQGAGTVVGIGLNVNHSAETLAQAGLVQAGSLFLCAGTTFDCRELAHLLIGHLDEEYDRLCEGDLAGLETCWKRWIGLLGKQVLAEGHDATHRGRLRDVTFARLELESPEGEVLHLRPEWVQHLEPAL